MKRQFFALLVILLSAATAASAHGDKKHVIGMIEKINAGSLTVKTRDDKSVEVKLVSATVFISRVGSVDKPAALSDLSVGDSVVIHATPKGDGLEADEVRFSAPGPSHPDPKTQQ